jgi:hypothetical protein
MTSQDDLAQARAAQAENLGKFVRDFQAKQLKDAAIVAAPGLAMAAWSAHQQSEARANEMLGQQQMLNQQMWIQNQLLSGRSMPDVHAQLDANDAAELAQQRANDEANQASARAVLRFVVCAVLAVFLSTRVSGMSFWPSTLIWVGIPIALLVGWNALLRRGRESRQGSAATTDGSTAPNLGVHEQWVDDFQAEHGRKLEADPPTG